METLASGYTLIEGPTWHPERGLLFSDVHDGGVFCLQEDGSVIPVVEHRRGIGGIALHADGGLVVGGRNVAYKGPASASTVSLLEQDVAGGIGFNDLTTDSAGRIYVGSLGASPFESTDADAPPKTGSLHLIDLDGTHRTISDGVALTNGLGFSPDGTVLYHSDSRERLVRKYVVNSDGTVEPWEKFADIRNGGPDGLAVAEDGSVWVAIAGGGCVIGFNADGTERQRVEIPNPMATSVCFGDEGLNSLYIVCGSEGSDSAHAGSIFRTQVGVAGLQVAPVRVAVG